MILRELSVDIVPVLTGAGIVGLAIGFGAQTLVKDIIAGFFLILEDQVRVGDSAVINQVPGVVEAINLRTIVLRDIEGSVHIFPNGAVTTLSNRSRDYAYAVLDVKVPFKHDVDEVVDALRDVGETLCVDPQFRPHILEPLEVLGIEAFDDATVTLKMRIKTVPLKQMDVARELRRRLKRMFDARGLAMPYPQVSVLFGQKK
jgi:small conductance mechanosensitive channel